MIPLMIQYVYHQNCSGVRGLLDASEQLDVLLLQLVLHYEHKGNISSIIENIFQNTNRECIVMS